MKVKVVNDREDIANERVEAIKDIKGISAIEKVIVDIQSNQIVKDVCSQIEPNDIVVLDVNLGDQENRWAGLEIFFKLFETGNPMDLSVVFDSGEGSCAELRNRWEKRQFSLSFDNLLKQGKIVFAHEDFSDDIVTAVRKALGFSFQDACNLLFNPFLCLHVAVQYIQANTEPDSQIFAEVDETDVYGFLEWDRENAQEYLNNLLKPYIQRFKPSLDIQPIESFLEGSLKTLCQILENETDLNKRLSKVIESGECATFLTEFQKAVDTLREINAH